MAFITGLMLIDAPAAALNNGQSENIEAQVKKIRSAQGEDFPYVSAQAYRYWLRSTLDTYFEAEWEASKIYTAGSGQRQQSYTEGDPIQYPDDDLLGYMRAEKNETVTRVSPLRTSTLVSVAPARVVSDFGVMARGKKEQGEKSGVLLHQHQFYRATLKGLFSLDLWAAGTFTNQNRSGYQNLSAEADVSGLRKIEYERFRESYDAYRLPDEERIRRVQVLLRAMGRIEGGAKQTLHYTDVTPAFVIAAVTRGGNNIFGNLIATNDRNEPIIHEGVLDQLSRTLADDLLSPVYVGRAAGFLDPEQGKLDQYGLTTMHPREALDALANDLSQNPSWMA